MKKLFSTFIFVAFVFMANAQQVHINREWRDYTGNPVFNPILNPFGLEWTKSIASASAGLITVGHTQVSGEGENILLTKYDDGGNIIFQSNYNTSGTQNDYGVDLIEDINNGDIYLVGTTDNGGTTDYDVVLLVYNSTGTLQYSTTYNGNDGLNDIGTAITIDSNGNISIAASSESTSTGYDYLYLCYDLSLSLLWSGSYDYATLTDVPVAIEDIGGKISIAGASASSLTDWDYTIAEFDPSNGSYNGDNRDNIPGVGYDQPLAFVKDGSNNTYITGRASSDGINYNIRTMKINPNNTIAWTQTIDANGLEDCGTSIAVDGSGNVIVGGFITNSNNKKELICLKYNSGGTLVWQQASPSKNPTGDAFIKKIALNTNNDIYYIGGEKGLSGNKEAIVGKIKSTGERKWEKSINGNYDYLPSDIQYGGFGAPGLFTIAIKDSTINVYETAYYTELELDTARATYGAANYKKNELVVRFQSSAIDTAAINNHVGTKVMEFGDLSSFLTASAYTTVINAISPYCGGGGFCDLKAAKIFPDMLTTDTLAYSKLNEPINMPDFWTALNVVLPSGLSVKDAHTVFNKIPSVVQYAHPNFLAVLHGSNDSLYNKQYSLHTNTVYTNADVNLEEAYKVIPNGGQPGVRCAVIDQNVDWQQKDFGYNGFNPASSKMAGGLWWGPNLLIKAQPHGSCYGDFHGSAVMGIIGATRNNTVGIAGIAGGNDSIASSGISLFSEGVYLDAGPNIGPAGLLSQVITYAALSATDVPNASPANKKYGCANAHIINCSWGFYEPPLDTGWYAAVNQNVTIVSEAVHFVNRLKTTVVASRGNGYNGPAYATLKTKTYPSGCDDDWVFCVSGTGTDGQFLHKNVAPFSGVNGELTSSFGGDIDVAAPATESLVTTLGSAAPNDFSPGITNNYISFGGTSAAAPHVSGAVGLIMSYLYDSTNAYATFPTPEDCEAIIQMSATDTDTSGYDQLTGYGRLNIGKAMRMIEKPVRKLWHFNTKAPFSYSVTKTLVSAVDTIRTTEQWSRKNPVGLATSFPKGKYIVKTYQINSTVFHNILPADTIIAIWPRPSSSVTFPPITGTGSNKKLMPREKTTIQGFNNSNCALRGYIYQVKDSTGTSVGWWPVDTAFINTYDYGEWAEYSVLTKNATTNGVKEHSELEKNISLYPNPTNANLTLEIKTTKVSQVTVDLYDVMGRKIKTVFSGKSDIEKTIISTDVANLPNSLYFYYITVDGAKTLKKFVKQ